jgi:alpha-galactosidase
MGLGSECFSYTLQPDETFDSPEAVMTYSAKGLGGMSRNFHRFIRNHLLPKEALTPHPVVLNTWEACYFDIDANKLLSFAKEASHCGFDMLVMDDGWFGSRNGETTGLGDWQENKTKFPMGLKSFVKEICRQGVSFGIWIEPEMVNPDSDLYRAHPEWCLQIDGRESFLARNQMVLDMTNPQVISYLKESFTQTFQGVDISYFKWDMNRHLCALGSSHLPKEQQGEIAFRYMKGVYSLLSWFRETFPHAVIETCSGGGGRYDLGMMPYGIQIWLSDNTDPYARMKMQWTALTAYPAATMSCHVSNPQNSLSSLDFRYHVAVGGMLGYELNILDMNDEIKERIKEQIQEYKTFEAVIRSGDYYGLVSPLTHPYAASYYVSEDNSKILLSLAETQTCKEGKTKLLKIKRADSRKIYIDQKTGKKYSGTDLKKGITLPLTGKENASRLLILTAQQ